MTPIKTILLALACFAAQPAVAQDSKTFFSQPVNIKQTGVNKVLCLKNGNTALLYFEESMGVVIKIFDSTRKEIASKKHICRYIDINKFHTSYFRGVHEVNGEVVLFIEQEPTGKSFLAMLRMSGQDGSLVEERVLHKSQNLSKNAVYRVIKAKNDSGYAILVCVDEPQFKHCDVGVQYYNTKHELTNTTKLNFERKTFDYLNVLGAESGPAGVNITFDLWTQQLNGTTSAISAAGAYYTHKINVFHMRDAASKPELIIADMDPGVSGSFTKYTYNPFAQAMNMLIYSYMPIRLNQGLNIGRGALMASNFLRINDDGSDLKMTTIYNAALHPFYQANGDLSRMYVGVPLCAFTNERGLTTIISEGYDRYDGPETNARYNLESYLGNIGILQVDDDGNEIWGSVLPKAQYFKSYRGYIGTDNMSRKREFGRFFNDLPEQVYERQFLSMNVYEYKGSIYIIHNDYNKNKNNSMKEPGVMMYTYSNSSPWYYKLDKTRQLVKMPLFGETPDNEYNTGFMEGADFDQQRGVYATLVQSRKDDKTTLRMAWHKME